ncbi:hypothetical protein D0864_08448 [Hortaea werneckii]|uniref:BTB domain-containing protein n=1 Tax=Hortaea werneckii TaxID=91943 RepID=A0A3M7EXY3_HORWE|nr:hypothetical protein KC352_g28825 [Hortaea werneckii]RMY81014.1 hypothetical protein D0864_08448 [Hortaea werneckii]
MSLASDPSTRPLAPVAFGELMESLADDEMVNIVLNHNGDVLRIQRTLLLNLSPWFDKALTSGFIEGQSLTLRFHDVPADVVQMFVYWIFHRRLPWDEDGPDAEMLETCRQHQALLARLWMFGEEHLLSELQHAAIRALSDQLLYAFPAVELLLEVYGGTAPGSSLRTVMANEVAWGWRGEQRPWSNHSPFYSRADLDRVGAISGFTADFAIALERQTVQAHLSDDERDACLWRLREA